MRRARVVDAVACRLLYALEIGEQLLCWRGRVAEGLDRGGALRRYGSFEIAAGNAEQPSASCPQEQVRQKRLRALSIRNARGCGDLGQKLTAIDREFHERCVTWLVNEGLSRNSSGGHDERFPFEFELRPRSGWRYLIRLPRRRS
jgi:hypothetical protein